MEWRPLLRPLRGVSPGPEHLPYIVHPEAVVGMLKEWGSNETEDAVTLAVFIWEYFNEMVYGNC